MPFVINPKKGYFVTANNRIAPDTALLDIGADQPSTGRAIRITQLIREGISKGHKFTVEDMIKI